MDPDKTTTIGEGEFDMTESDFQSMKAVLRTRRKFRICEAVCRMEAREDGRDENMFAVVPVEMCFRYGCPDARGGMCGSAS
jgi:hypothetical protein